MRSRAETGRLGEEAVARRLESEGWAILGRNVRVGALELDIVARKGPLVAVVEVRARGAGSFVGPFASITRVKRERLLRATQGLLRGQLRGMEGVERVRIDVAAVNVTGPRVEITYAAGAIVGGDG